MERTGEGGRTDGTNSSPPPCDHSGRPPPPPFVPIILLPSCVFRPSSCPFRSFVPSILLPHVFVPSFLPTRE